MASDPKSSRYVCPETKRLPIICLERPTSSDVKNGTPDQQISLTTKYIQRRQVPCQPWEWRFLASPIPNVAFYFLWYRRFWVSCAVGGLAYRVGFLATRSDDVDNWEWTIFILNVYSCFSDSPICRGSRSYQSTTCFGYCISCAAQLNLDLYSAVYTITF